MSCSAGADGVGAPGSGVAGGLPPHATTSKTANANFFVIGGEAIYGSFVSGSVSASVR